MTSKIMVPQLVADVFTSVVIPHIPLSHRKHYSSSIYWPYRHTQHRQHNILSPSAMFPTRTG